MIRCASFCLVTFLKSFGDFFSNRAFPRSICVLPREAIMFSRRAKDTLGVLVHLRTIMLCLSVLVLCLDEPTTNPNNIQFVRANAPIQYLLTACFRIKRPLAFALHDGNRKGKIVVTYKENSAVRIVLVYFRRTLFLRLGCERERAILVLHRIFGTDDVVAART